jgi:hypothetical protein
MLLFMGCAATLTPDPVSEDTGAVADTGPVEVDTAIDDEGLVTKSITIDSTDYEAWVYVDLETGTIGTEDDKTWDLALRRYVLALRGGVIGTGEVSAAVLEEASFDDLTVSPADGYMVDEPDGDDDDKEPEYVLGGWYDYDSSTHVLTPAAVVYAIWTGEGYHRLEMLNYYSEAGTSGHLSFQWGEINPPEEK